MGMGVRGRQGIGFGRESIAFGQGGRRAASPAVATLGAPRADRPTPSPREGSPSVEAPRAVPQERSTEQVAVWIRALLRLEPELRLPGLAEELDLSDRRFGQALGLLIRQGKARIRKAPGGIRVVRVETAYQERPPMPHERR
jgi:hypothetical protein